uniref:Uncharacterized protein n=1 Tax=Lepeophtheirus salmonis TaxID=72036 RepID=A0A0K2TNZ2_LEPSM
MSLLYRLKESQDLEIPQTSKLEFLIEQLALLFQNPKARRYSAGLLSVCLLWQNMITTLYDQILIHQILSKFHVPSILVPFQVLWRQLCQFQPYNIKVPE